MLWKISLDNRFRVLIKGMDPSRGDKGARLVTELYPLFALLGTWPGSNSRLKKRTILFWLL